MGEIQVKKINIGGRTVSYLTAGTGDPLVVIHGGGGGAVTWDRNILALAEDYTVYAPDLPGYGGSQPLEGDFYVAELAEFIEVFTRSLGLEQFYLVGHSLGGGIALSFALRFPRKIRKLVLISSLCLGGDIALWVRMASPFSRFIVTAMRLSLRAALWLVKTLALPLRPVMPKAETMVGMGRKITGLREQSVVLAHRLSELVMPTLVVWGQYDVIVPVRQAYAAAEVIPDCRLRVFEGRGHDVHREELDEFSRLLAGFLS